MGTHDSIFDYFSGGAEGLSGVIKSKQKFNVATHLIKLILGYTVTKLGKTVLEEL